MLPWGATFVLYKSQFQDQAAVLLAPPQVPAQEPAMNPDEQIASQVEQALSHNEQLPQYVHRWTVAQALAIDDVRLVANSMRTTAGGVQCKFISRIALPHIRANCQKL